jgi:hypothetical protein
MISDIGYYTIRGLPLMAYLGATTIILVFSTATLGYLIQKGKTQLTMKHHQMLAGIAMTIAALHGLLGLLFYL